MKKFLQVVAIGSVLMAGCGSDEVSNSAVNDASMFDPRELVAGLSDLDLDKDLGIDKAYGASVTISQSDREVSLQITTCPPNALCSHLGPDYSAKIVNQKVTSCGVRMTTAKTDRRPVDGALTQITVTDNSKSTCDINYPFMTKVELTTSIVNRRTGKEVSTFSTLKGTDILK